MTDIFNALFDFFDIIKESVISFFEGLFTLATALSDVLQSATFVGLWMPSGIAMIVSVGVVLVIILRLVGR